MPQYVAAEEVYSAEYARWGVYGDNGVGKSYLVSTVPKDFRTLVVSVGRENIKPYLGHGDHITVTKIHQWEELFDLLTDLKTMINGRIRAGKKPLFGAIAFDTWTRLQGSATRMIAGWNPPGDLAGLARALKEAPKTPRGYDAWQRVGELSNQWMDYFLELQCHIFMLFQEEMRTPTTGTGESAIQTGPTRVGPMLTPAAQQGVLNSLELVGRLYVEVEGQEASPVEEGYGGIKLGIDPEAKEMRRLLIGKHPLYRTKGPTHVLSYTIVNPSWNKLAKSLGAHPLEIGEDGLESTQEEEEN